MTVEDFDVIPLSVLLKRFGEQNVSAILKYYKSVYDSSTESFLHDRAIEMEKRALARTYVAIDNRDHVIGYVTLGIKCLQVTKDANIDKKTAHRMNIEQDSKVAQSYLLGQLSRSKDAPKGLGKELVRAALDELSIAKKKVGCRTLRLDCHDELVPYYEGLGFKYICKNREGNLNQMVTFIRCMY